MTTQMPLPRWTKLGELRAVMATPTQADRAVQTGTILMPDEDGRERPVAVRAVSLMIGAGPNARRILLPVNRD